MHGQYFANRKINVEYAFKDNPQKRKTERHGTQAERVLAQNKPLISRPGFFGLNNKMESKSLKLPPSLLAVRNSHLLSKESRVTATHDPFAALGKGPKLDSQGIMPPPPPSKFYFNK